MLSLTIEAVSGELHQLLNEMAGFKRTPAARASSLVPGFPSALLVGVYPAAEGRAPDGQRRGSQRRGGSSAKPHDAGLGNVRAGGTAAM